MSGKPVEERSTAPSWVGRNADFFAGLPDVSSAEREHEIVGTGGGDKCVYTTIESAYVLDAAVAELTDAIGQRLGSDALDRLLGSGVNIHDEDAVRLHEGARKVVHEMKSA